MTLMQAADARLPRDFALQSHLLEHILAVLPPRELHEDEQHVDPLYAVIDIESNEAVSSRPFVGP